MRFGICIPQHFGDGAFDGDAMHTYLARAEALGFESAWTQEQTLGTSPSLGPIEVMAYAAACTERMRLGCAVFVTPLHSPVHLAKSISSLDQLSRGRVEVGVGIGGRRMFSAFAVDPAHLVTRFNEGIDLMKELWTKPAVTFDGRFWQLEKAVQEPKPFQKPYPPLWLGGNQPAAVRRAVTRADGFFGAGSQTTAQFAGHVRLVREELAQQGRPLGDFGLAKRVYIAVDDDLSRARTRIGAALQELYRFFGLPDLTPVAVFGPPEACVKGIRDVAEAGAERILLNPMFDEAEQMERLAAEVVPELTAEAGP
jgi:probable F420-dependent oxidoreductase